LLSNILEYPVKDENNNLDSTYFSLYKAFDALVLVMTKI